MDLQDANWERFCRYHVGDWYGLWTPYTLDGVALAPWQCIRSFQRTADGRAITHQNHYRYANGRQETKTFGPYTPATTRAVFVEASFSLGSPAVTDATPFAFETGFRVAEHRVSLVARRDAHEGAQAPPAGGWQLLAVLADLARSAGLRTNQAALGGGLRPHQCPQRAEGRRGPVFGPLRPSTNRDKLSGANIYRGSEYSADAHKQNGQDHAHCIALAARAGHALC
jgi:uncharacterized protein DUF3598